MYKTEETERIEADFGKLIKHYAYKFEIKEDREDVEAELWSFLYSLIESGRGISQRYVAVAIRNKYIAISKSYQEKLKNETNSSDFYVKVKNDRFIEEIEMRDLLNKLGVKQREVIVLHHVYGLSFEEIANKRGCTRQATTRLNNRGIEELRKILFKNKKCTKRDSFHGGTTHEHS